MKSITITQVAYHGKQSIDDLIVAALDVGAIFVDFESGLAWSTHWPRPLGCSNQKGYRVSTLHFRGYRVQVKLHRLVWIAAHGIPEPDLVVDHINRNKADNRLANLRLVTSSQNSRNRRRYTGEGNPAAKISWQIAGAIRTDYRSVASYQKVANKYGVSKSLIAQIIRRELWVV